MSRPSLLTARVLIPFTVATVIWGSTWIVIRDQLGVVPPTWSVTYRFLVAGIAMFAYALVTRQSLRLGREGQVFAALYGVSLFVLNFNFVYRAEAHITSGLVAVIFALLIVPNAILARIFLKHPLSPRFLLGSAIALGGVALLIIQEARADTSTGGETWLGLGLTLAGVLAASVANVMQATERARSLPIASMIAWGMFYGTVANAVLALVVAGPPIIEPRLGYILGTLHLGLLASALAFTCYFSVIRAVGPGVAAYSSVLTPVFAMILSTVFEDYRWTWLAAAGGALVFAGLLIALIAPRPATKSG